ncbi:MAG: molybdopterin-binding protein [Nitrospirae bacterium]|nr:molybdopterin-binding protein [Nitrospirota bacterium]
MEQETAKTAGLIIIGNEILSGKVRDSNSFYLASELRSLGVELARISVIPDDAELIGKEVSLFSRTYDYVFTSGGIGPTHDDITMEGIARGFSIRTKRHPVLAERFRKYYGERTNAAVMKMSEIPEGAELVDSGTSGFPVVSFRNVFVLPGIPRYFREKFSAIRERFRSSAFYLRRIFLNANESDIAEILNAVVAENAEVAFGSYPELDSAEYRIIVTAESRSRNLLDESVHSLLARLPENTLVRLE